MLFISLNKFCCENVYCFFFRYVVKELLTTEENYVEQLESVVKVVFENITKLINFCLTIASILFIQKKLVWATF